MVGHDQQLTKAYNDEVRRRVKKTVDNQKKHDEKTVGKKHDETTVNDNWGSWEKWWLEVESEWTGKDTTGNDTVQETDTKDTTSNDTVQETGGSSSSSSNAATTHWSHSLWFGY